jgi:hypothetical protein
MVVLILLDIREQANLDQLCGLVRKLSKNCCVRCVHLIPFGYLWVTSTAMIKNYQKLMVFSLSAEISRAKLSTN